MLAEIFIVRLESILRGLAVSSPTSSDSRFVPFKFPTKPAKSEPQQNGK